MNAALLLKHYARIADAPDAIARLRRFVLDLAVRGKLVEQDPCDEPASELLKRIATEKKRLVATGKIWPIRPAELVEEVEVPFQLPLAWKWVRLADILTKLTDGTHHSPPNGPTGDILYITAKNIKNEGVRLDKITYVSRQVHEEIYSRCNPEPGDVLYIKDGATTGVVTVNNLEEPFSMLSSVALLKLPSCVANRLIVEFLRSPFFYDQMRGFMKGAAITRVTLKRMGPALFPLPPLAEQHRIVAKVDELMALCDKLEATRAEREHSRDHFALSTLARLNEPDPATFANDASFALVNLAPLTTRADQIKQLRQTILNLAVRGKLLEQVSDENCRQMPDQKERRAAERKLDLDLPSNWQWARISDVASSRLGKMLDKAKNRGSMYPYLRNTNVHWFDIRIDDIKNIALTDVELEDYLLCPGDVLICEGGHGIGRTAVWRGDHAGMTFQKALHRVRPGPELASDFFAFCCSVYFHEGITETYFTGVGIPHFTGRALAQLIFPLPPAAEQHRIIAKVDELMALCDQLEASITTGEQTRSQLLEAVLHHAIQPAAAAELEPV